MGVPADFPQSRAHVPLIALGSCAGFSLFRLLVLQLSARCWRGFKSLSANDQRAWPLRWASELHAALTAYNAYFCLRDPLLVDDRLWGLNERHYWCAGISCGYFIFDTLMVRHQPSLHPATECVLTSTGTCATVRGPSVQRGRAQVRRARSDRGPPLLRPAVHADRAHLQYDGILWVRCLSVLG